MRLNFLFLLTLILALPLALLTGPSLATQDAAKEEPRVGGPCEYRRYEGQAKITSVRKATESKDRPAKTYSVRFKFIPAQKIEEPFVKVEGREFLLEINSSSSLSREFIKKHHIRPGSLFDGYIRVIVKGTCTPVLFEFPSLSSK